MKSSDEMEKKDSVTKDMEEESDSDDVVCSNPEDTIITKNDGNNEMMLVHENMAEEVNSVEIFGGRPLRRAISTSVVSIASSGKTTIGGTHITNIHQTESLKALTKCVLDEQKRKKYVKTKQFDSALKYIRGSKKLIILSNLGEGRTSLGLELLIELSEVESAEHYPKEPLILRQASEWRLNVIPSEDTVLFLDDQFGRIMLNEKHYKEWENVLPDVQAAIDHVDSCLFLIIAMNKYIFNQLNRRLQRFNLFSEMERYTVDLSLYDLEDKNLILTEMVPDMKESDIIEILGIQNPMAFPSCCSSFVRNPVYLKQGCEFFKNPIEILYTELYTLCEKDKFAFILLSIILFSEADIYLKNIFCKDTMAPLIKQLANLCFVKNVVYKGLLGRLEIKLTHLGNVLIEDNKEKLCFISSATEMAMIKVFGDMHKGFLIKYLRFNLLVKNITADVTNGKKVFIDEFYYEELSKRFIQELERFKRCVPKIKEYITYIVHCEMIESNTYRSIFVGDFVRMRNFKKIIQCKAVNIISTIFQNQHENSLMFVCELLIQRTNIVKQGCCGFKSDWFTKAFHRSVRRAVERKDAGASEVFGDFYDIPNTSLYYVYGELLPDTRFAKYSTDTDSTTSSNASSINTAL